MVIRLWKAEITEMISDKLKNKEKKSGSKKICQGNDKIQLHKLTALSTASTSDAKWL